MASPGGDVCAGANVTYYHRVDDPDNYNFCLVPESGYDAVLFAGVALLVACVVCGRLSAVWVLVAGALCELASFRVNLGRFGNSVALWLGGIHPGETFFYVFLPPLLLDSAARLDYFVFKKVLVLSLVFAFVLVCTGTFLAVPIMLYGMGLGRRYGWGWQDVALFNAMLASTDAVAVTSVLRAGGAPELLGALLEGESLFNDASGIVLFDIFLKKVIQGRREAAEDEADGLTHGSSSSSSSASRFGSLLSLWSHGAADAYGAKPFIHRHPRPHSHVPGAPPPPPGAGGGGWWPPGPWLPGWLLESLPELLEVGSEFAWLVLGGVLVGFACGYVTRWTLRLLQWRRLPPHVEVAVTFAAGYLSFYVANAYLAASGVIAVVVFGVYGSATGTWGLSSQARRARAFDRFWDVMSFCINGLIFFFVGASSVNYLIRLGAELDQDQTDPSSTTSLLLETLMQLPLVYVILFAMRGALIFAFCYTARALDARRARKESISKAAQHAHHNPHDASTALEAGGGSGAVRHLPHQQHTPGAVTTTHAADGQVVDSHNRKQQLQHAHHHHTATPDARGMLFATMAGLRGAVSLIMGQIVLAAVRSSEPAAVQQGLYGSGGPGPHGTDAQKRDKYVTAQMMVWTSGFVLMSLVINAPMLTPLMRVLRLNTTSPIKQQVRERAKAALKRFTTNALSDMRAAAEAADAADSSGGLDMGLMLLRGVDWNYVERIVDLSRKLEAVFPASKSHAGSSHHKHALAHTPPTAAAAAADATEAAAFAAAGAGVGSTPPRDGARLRRAASRRQLPPPTGADGGGGLAEQLLPRGGSEDGGGGGDGGRGGRYHPPTATVVTARSSRVTAPRLHGSGPSVSFADAAAEPSARTLGEAGSSGGGRAVTVAAASPPPLPPAAAPAPQPTAVPPPSAILSAFGAPGAADATARELGATTSVFSSIAAAAGGPGGSSRPSSDQAPLQVVVDQPTPPQQQSLQQYGEAAASPAPLTRAPSSRGLTRAPSTTNLKRVPSTLGMLLSSITGAGAGDQQEQQTGVLHRQTSVGDGAAADGGSGPPRGVEHTDSDLARRTRQLDERFAAMQGGDDAGYGGECPFASYTTAQPPSPRGALQPALSFGRTAPPPPSLRDDSTTRSATSISPHSSMSAKALKHFHVPGDKHAAAATATAVPTPGGGGGGGSRGGSITRASPQDSVLGGASPRSQQGVSPPAKTGIPQERRLSGSGGGGVANGKPPRPMPPAASSRGGSGTSARDAAADAAAAAAAGGSQPTEVSGVDAGADGFSFHGGLAAAAHPLFGTTPMLTSYVSAGSRISQQSSAAAATSPEALQHRPGGACDGAEGPAATAAKRMQQLPEVEVAADEEHEHEQRHKHEHEEDHGRDEDQDLVLGGMDLESGYHSDNESDDEDSYGHVAFAFAGHCGLVGDRYGSGFAPPIALRVAGGTGLRTPRPSLDVSEEEGSEEEEEKEGEGPAGEEREGGERGGRSGAGKDKGACVAVAAAEKLAAVVAASAAAAARPGQMASAALETLHEDGEEGEMSSVGGSLRGGGAAAAALAAAAAAGREVLPPAEVAEVRAELSGMGPQPEELLHEAHMRRAGSAPAWRPSAPEPDSDQTDNERNAVTAAAAASEPLRFPPPSPFAALSLALPSAPSVSEAREGPLAHPEAPGGAEVRDVPIGSEPPASVGTVASVTSVDGEGSGPPSLEHSRSDGRLLRQRRQSDGVAGARQLLPGSKSQGQVSSGSEAGRSSVRRRTGQQFRMSPSFAIGAGAGEPTAELAAAAGASRAASLAHPSALTRHLSLSRPRGALGSGPAAAAAAAAAATPPATPWRLTRQPSTRWVSVSATDAAKQYGSQSAASGRASGVGGGLAPPSRAVLSRRHGSGGALAAAGAAAAGAEGSATATAVPPQGRSWASLQDLAGQQRTLDTLGPLPGSHVTGGPGVCGPGSIAPSSTADPHAREEAAQELLVEYRIRLLAGFKRFFHEQTLEGVLSPHGMRLLCHCCDEALHTPSAPLDLWGCAEREVVGRGAVQWQAWAHLALRRFNQRVLRAGPWLPTFVKTGLVRPLRALAELLSSSLSRVMLVGLEVAVELAAALSESSPQLQWLRYAGPAGQTIWAEVQQQAELVRKFILDRVIEAPDRFQATQSHRAALALLRQQVAFVRSMLKTGLVDADEAEALAEPIERRIWRLEARGPKWTQPTLTQVLSSCAVLRGVPDAGLDWLRTAGDLRPFPRGADLTGLIAGGGVFIVVLGTVRVTVARQAAQAAAGAAATAAAIAAAAAGGLAEVGGTGPHAPPPQFFVGVGGVVGISTALLGRAVAGMAVAAAVAEGNALGKGPVVFALPPAAVAAVRSRAAAGQAPFQQLLSNMYRLVGVHVLERQRATLVAHIAALLTAAVVHAYRAGGAAKAAKLRRLLVQQAGPGERNTAAAATSSLRRKQKAVLDEVYDAPAAGLMSAPSRSLPGRGIQDGGAVHDAFHDGYEEDEEEDDEEGSEEGEGGGLWGEGERTNSSRGSHTHSALSAAGAVAAALAADEVLSRRCLERAVDIVEAVRQGIKAAALVMLQPGQSLVQRSTVVLVNGSLLQHPEPEATTAQGGPGSGAAGEAPTPSAPGPARRTSVSGAAAAGGRTNLSPNPDGQADPATLSRATTASLRRNRSFGAGLLTPRDNVATGSGMGPEAGAPGIAATAAAAAAVADGGVDGTKGPGPVPLTAAPEQGQGQGQGQGQAALTRSKSYKSIKRESTAGDGAGGPSSAPLPVFKPPTILLWLPDHCEPAVGRIFKQSDSLRYTAGTSGATVLVCGGLEEAPSYT